MTAAHQTGWRALLQGRQGRYCLGLASGIMLYAIIVPVSYTILPSLTRELQAEAWYASIATLFALGSLIGACLLSHSLRRLPAHKAYLGALLLFAGSTLACAGAPALPFLLAACTFQGLSGGLLVALSYHRLNTGLPPALLPRSIGLISAAWGLATLIGPYLGGRAENWRTAFLIIGLCGLLLCAASFFILKESDEKADKREEQPAAAPPFLPIFLLAALILTISSGTILGGLGLLLLLAAVEKKAKKSLLPKGTFSFNSVLAPLYGIIILNMAALGGAKLYLPLFLQDLHQAGPISAGYISFADTIGWTIGVLIGAACDSGKGKTSRPQPLHHRGKPAAPRLIFIIAPLGCLIGLGSALGLVPILSDSLIILLLIGGAFFITGFFSGLFWPHILACIMRHAGQKEQASAGSSLVIVQFFAAALADCLAGAVAQASGGPTGNAAALAHMATVLFAYCLLLLIIVFFLCLKVRAWPRL